MRRTIAGLELRRHRWLRCAEIAWLSLDDDTSATLPQTSELHEEVGCRAVGNGVGRLRFALSKEASRLPFRKAQRHSGKRCSKSRTSGTRPHTSHRSRRSGRRKMLHCLHERTGHRPAAQWPCSGSAQTADARRITKAPKRDRRTLNIPSSLNQVAPNTAVLESK